MTARRFTKGQVEMNETILVLFALFIIFGLGMIFYYKFVYQGLESTGQELTEQESSVLLVSVASLPEIGCDGEFCIDGTKLTLFKTFSKNNLEYYKSKWGYRKIWVEQVYPVIKNEKECTPLVYNSLDYPDNCKFWVIYDNKPSNSKGSFKVSSIYPLYFPEIDKFRIGRLNIEVYK